MSTSTRHWISSFLILLILAGFALAAVMLFALDAENGLSFVIGIFWALLLLIVLWGGNMLWRRGHKALVGLIALLCFLAANVVITLMIVNPQKTVWETLKPRFLISPRESIASYGIQARTLSRDAVQVTDYHMTLTPVDQTLTAFQAKVNIRFQENGQEKTVSVTQSETIQVGKSKQGWLLKEIRLPLPQKTAAQFTWKEAGVSREAENICCFRPITITLQNLPKGVFYEARDSGNVKTSVYGGTETIEWEILDRWGDREYAEFSIVPPPYYRVPFIHRFASLSSVADWVFTLGGMLGSSLLASLLIPVVKDLGQQKVKHSLSMKSKTRPPLEKEPDDAILPLAKHISSRLSHTQFLALRDEIDKLLPRKD